MFVAYFDESGTPDSSHRVLTVAGFVSTVKKWARFETDWVRILEEAGLPRGTVFHMNKFASSRPPYECFKGQSERKAKFVHELVTCIKRNVNNAFSCSVNLNDWDRLNRHYCIAESLGYPYTICGRTCIAQLMKWARSKGIASSQTKFFFEDGATHKGQLEKLVRANNDATGQIFLRKPDVVPFQAADLLAWKSHKVVTQVVDYSGPLENIAEFISVHRSMLGVKSIPNSYGFHAYESMKKLAICAGIPKRSATE